MWLHVPSACLQEEAGSTLDSGWRSTMLAQSVTWKETHKPSAFWLKKCAKDALMMRLSGQMSAPSTANRGVERWIASLVDSPANQAAPPVSERGQMTADGSGLTSDDSYRRSCRQLSSSRTSEDCYRLIKGKHSAACFKTWPTWGTMRHGVLFERPTPEHLIKEHASSSWPTATANSMTGAGSSGRDGGLNIQTAADKWATPTAHNAKGLGQPGQKDLVRDIRGWHTPRSSDSKGDSKSRRQEKWQLREQGVAWLTPSANEDAAGTVNGQMQKMLSHQARAMSGETSTRPTIRRLNPRFVEWLMGWPRGWLETHN